MQGAVEAGATQPLQVFEPGVADGADSAPHSIAWATSGWPQTHLVTPVTSIPWVRHRSTITLALCSILPRSMVT